MPFVQANCLNCGGLLAVDKDKDAAICQFCGPPFIVEKAITYYSNTFNISNATFNVSEFSIDNLIARAETFEKEGNIEEAKEYYNKVLDIDINNELANNKLEELRSPDERLIIRITKEYGIKVDQYQVKEIKECIRIKAKTALIKAVKDTTGISLTSA